jgi:hypothetical protein
VHKAAVVAVAPNATRKRRSVGMRPGAWPGACVFTDQNLARKFLSQIKWDKLKLCVKWFLDHALKRIVATRKMVLEKRGWFIVAALMISFHYILEVYIYLWRSGNLASLAMGGNVKTILIPCLQQQ